MSFEPNQKLNDFPCNLCKNIVKPKEECQGCPVLEMTWEQKELIKEKLIKELRGDKTTESPRG